MNKIESADNTLESQRSNLRVNSDFIGVDRNAHLKLEFQKGASK
jgi:hypothetical protein